MLWKKIVLISLVSLGGCNLFTSHHAAPVIELSHDAALLSQEVHLVKHGQTLYEIAFEHGCDYRDLAITNHILPPYVIYPGQKLALKKSKHPMPKKIVPKKATVLAVSKPNTSKAIAKKPIEVPMVVTQTPFNNDWDWPVKGKIIKPYSTLDQNINKGVDISGRMGEEIKAASAGRVVYSGAGLRGYGQLIIIKHNDIYLSAYAHNSVLLAKEGEVIKKGQIIAKMGKTDSDNIKLHFEIRKNGQPINPLTVLPKQPV